MHTCHLFGINYGMEFERLCVQSSFSTLSPFLEGRMDVVLLQLMQNKYVFGQRPHINLLITVNINTFKVFFLLLNSVWCRFYTTRRATYVRPKGRTSNKQLSLQYLAGTHQIQTRMKDRGKAPPTQLLYVPLHAAEFIKLSMWGEIKAAALGGFPLLAYCLNMTASVFEYCTDAWLRAFSHHASDPRSCLLSTHRLKFLFFLSLFFYKYAC